MMDDREDRLDNLIRDAARDYHAPPATPRAEMWEAIRASREAAGTEVRPLVVRPARSPLRLVFGIAALLALGVAIGRLTPSPRATAPALLRRSRPWPPRPKQLRPRRSSASGAKRRPVMPPMIT